MDHKIVRTSIIYKNNKPSQMAVLWDDDGMFRATIKTIDSEITNNLIKHVAAFGHYLTDSEKKTHFPKIKNWSR